MSAANCYVYVYEVDGVVRYVGRGRGRRIDQHLNNAARYARGEPVRQQRLYACLAAALEGGAKITRRKIVEGLDGDQAKAREMLEIGNFPRDHLWNTVFSNHPKVTDSAYLEVLSAAAKKKWKDPEFRTKMATAIAARLADPEYRAKIAALFSTPEHREKLREAQARPEVKKRSVVSHKAWAASPEGRRHMEVMAEVLRQPETRKKTAAAVRASHRSPENRLRASEAAIAAYARPGVRERVAAANKAAAVRPEVREVTGARMRDPIVRAKARAALATPEGRAKLSAARKAKWRDDPAYREKMIAVNRENNRRRSEAAKK